nr:hypothetical protein [Tanacetum cinerariifolium]
KDSVPVPADEEPIQKGKSVKRSAKKSSTTPTTGIIIREPHVETQSKRKEKQVDDDNEDDDKSEGDEDRGMDINPEASHVYTNIPQSLQTFTSLPLQSTPSPLPTTKTKNIPSSILDFTLVFRFNDRVIAL